MADEHKAKADQNALRIAQWLADNSAQFEAQGVEEASLAAAVGLSAEEVALAVDHLENREAVARLPHGHTVPPQFVLKPARGWDDIKAEILGRAGGSDHS